MDGAYDLHDALSCAAVSHVTMRSASTVTQASAGALPTPINQPSMRRDRIEAPHLSMLE